MAFPFKWRRLGCFLLLMQVGVGFAFADSSSDNSDNGTKKTYYWQGSQLDNLSRLAGGSPEFEQEERRTQMDHNKDSYLANIRQQMGQQAKAGDKNRTVMAFDGQIPQEALDVRYGGTEILVTLHAQMLFDDNSASLRRGGVDVIDRLRKLLQSGGQRPVELTIMDTLDDAPRVADVDAERTLLILGVLEFPTRRSQQENLSPEKLVLP